MTHIKGKAVEDMLGFYGRVWRSQMPISGEVSLTVRRVCHIPSVEELSEKILWLSSNCININMPHSQIDSFDMYFYLYSQKVIFLMMNMKHILSNWQLFLVHQKTSRNVLRFLESVCKVEMAMAVKRYLSLDPCSFAKSLNLFLQSIVIDLSCSSRLCRMVYWTQCIAYNCVCCYGYH